MKDARFTPVRRDFVGGGWSGIRTFTEMVEFKL